VNRATRRKEAIGRRETLTDEQAGRQPTGGKGGNRHRHGVAECGRHQKEPVDILDVIKGPAGGGWLSGPCLHLVAIRRATAMTRSGNRGLLRRNAGPFPQVYPSVHHDHGEAHSRHLPVPGGAGRGGPARFGPFRDVAVGPACRLPNMCKGRTCATGGGGTGVIKSGVVCGKTRGLRLF